jgi:hypothetical protein
MGINLLSDLASFIMAHPTFGGHLASFNQAILLGQRQVADKPEAS